MDSTSLYDNPDRDPSCGQGKEQISPRCIGAARSCDQFHVALFIFTTVAAWSHGRRLQEVKSQTTSEGGGIYDFQCNNTNTSRRLVYDTRKRY